MHVLIPSGNSAFIDFAVTYINEIVIAVRAKKNETKNLVAWMVSNCNSNSNRELYGDELEKFVSLGLYQHFKSCFFV